jgi:hypothetical protein
VGNNFSARWSCSRGAIEIEGSIKGGMSRKRRMNSGGPEKVLESEECLQEEETIPFGKWIATTGSGQRCRE